MILGPDIEDFDTDGFISAFKATRSPEQDDAIDAIDPSVRAWLADFDNTKLRDAVVDAASAVWTKEYQDQTRRSGFRAALRKFRESIGESLTMTSTPSDPVDPAQVDRIAAWLAVSAINSGFVAGFAATGGSRVRWLTMHDDKVRETHKEADGTTTKIGGTFDIGGYHLHYPGEPVGPPDIWINCRCVIAPAGRNGRVTNALAAAAPIDEAEPDDVIPDDVDISDEDLVDEPMIEIPVHGVATIEGQPTGDNRMFANGSLTNRDLPLPMRYEFVGTHGGDTSMVAPVGRIDELFRGGENDSEYRFRGVIITTKAHANEALEGIADGSLTGVSVEVDNITLDPDNEAAKMDHIMSLADGEMPDEKLLNTDIFSEARVCGFTIVPIPAYQEGYISLGGAFPDELTDDDRAAMAACGCMDEVEDEDFRTISADERKKMADNGEALPDGSFPIANVDDLKNAIQAIGRAKDPAAAKAHIIKRAKALGQSDLIPADWSAQVVVSTGEPNLNQFTSTLSVGAATYILNASANTNTFVPGTHDGPGWITNPRATARIRRYWTHGKGALKIKWGVPGDFNRCRLQLGKYVQNPEWLAGLCANMHKEAIGLWPGQEDGGRIGHRHSLMAAGAPAAPLFSLVAAAPVVAPREFFEDPKLTGPTPLQVDLETGRVFGHLATWGVCHIGIPGTCTTAPHSNSRYAYYRTGVVRADDGTDIAVGHITLATGHAPIKASAQAAAAHYDNTGSVVADVAAGEDSYGIWLAGALRHDVDEKLATTLRAAALSGDWRTIAGSLELVGALAVNVPGFPIPRNALAASGERQTALVAAGIVEQGGVTASGEALTPEAVAAITRNAVAEYRHQEKREQRLEPLRVVRDEVRKERIADVRSKVQED